MSQKILVAGVGNIFKRDDGFGVAVVERLLKDPVPVGVEVVDYGIRGVHLAYTLLDGYDLLVLIDAVERDGPPGTLYLIEADLTPTPVPEGEAPEPHMVDAHDMAPQEVLALVPALGGTVNRVMVIGCQPESIEDGMGLSDPVSASIEDAARMVVELLQTEMDTSAVGRGESSS